MTVGQHLRTSLLLVILVTTFSSVQAGASATTVQVSTDSIPKSSPSQASKSTLSPAPTSNDAKEMFGSIREKMPTFPGCDEQPTYQQKKACSDSLLLKFIYGNLRYPYFAWRDSVEGMAVISFYVEKDGAVTGAKIVRDPGAGTGTEALRLVNLMAEKNPRWTPGEQMNKPVRVQFNLPVKFKLTAETMPYPPPPPPPVDCIDHFKVVEQMPRFPGCEHLTDRQERKTCANERLLKYLHNNLELTPLQKQSCSSGMVVIQFVVNTDGSVGNAKIMRDIGAGYGKAALEAVESMNKKGIRWMPGRHRGKAVPVQMNVPVRIRLD